MDKSLRRLYFDEYKQGKISSNEMCDEIVYILIHSGFRQMGPTEIQMF